MNNSFLHRAGPALGVVLGIVALATIARGFQSGTAQTSPASTAPKAVAAAAAGQAPVGERPMPMFGGSPSRNMVNAYDQGAPTEWDVETKKNIKWAVQIGSRSYGGPIVADGKIYIGTNNQNPRNPRDAKKTAGGKAEPVDMGVLMVFDQATGKFLWQMVNDKLPSGRVHDWPKEGLCCTVEGDRRRLRVRDEPLYAQSVPPSTASASGKNVGVTDELFKSLTDADMLFGRYDDQGAERQQHVVELPAHPRRSPFRHDLERRRRRPPEPAVAGRAELHLPQQEDRQARLARRHAGQNVGTASGRACPTSSTRRDASEVIFPGGDAAGLPPSSTRPPGEHLAWRFDANPKDSKYDYRRQGTRSDFIGTPRLLRRQDLHRRRPGSRAQ